MTIYETEEKVMVTIPVEDAERLMEIAALASYLLYEKAKSEKRKLDGKLIMDCAVKVDSDINRISARNNIKIKRI